MIVRAPHSLKETENCGRAGSSAGEQKVDGLVLRRQADEKIYSRLGRFLLSSKQLETKTLQDWQTSFEMKTVTIL